MYFIMFFFYIYLLSQRFESIKEMFMELFVIFMFIRYKRTEITGVC